MVFDVASITDSENAVNGAGQFNASQAGRPYRVVERRSGPVRNEEQITHAFVRRRQGMFWLQKPFSIGR